jgi:tRNA1(Val) A37 N6-methylase TrmN6
MKELVASGDLVLMSLLRHCLNEEDIDFDVFDGFVGSLFPGDITVASARIMVRNEDFERAKCLLDEIQNAKTDCVTLPIETTEDLFLGGKVRLLQPKDGYRAATDPVFLAASIPAKSGQKVLDVGCGVGAATFCLAARIEGVHITGLEIQTDLLAIGEQNRLLNNMSDRIRFVEGDLKMRPMDPEPNSFDHVMANPPFYEAGSGWRPSSEIKARAHMEEDASLTDWVDYILRMTKPKGSVTFINRTERLEETLTALKGRLGDMILYPLWSMSPVGEDRRPAKRFLLQGRKGIKTQMKFSPGLVVHHKDGGYTDRAADILKHAGGLDLTL